MRILLVNDDGLYSPGIQFLIRTLQDEHLLLVVAPSQNQSCKGGRISINGISYDVKETSERRTIVAVDAFPADCAVLARYFAEKYDFRPDLCISGINAGANTGFDQQFSGTLAAALTASLFCKAMAISNAQWDHGNLEALGPEIMRVIRYYADNSFPHSVLNVNLPSGAASRGFKLCAVQQRFNCWIRMDSVRENAFSNTLDFLECEHVAGQDISECRSGFITLSFIDTCDGRAGLGRGGDVTQVIAI